MQFPSKKDIWHYLTFYGFSIFFVFPIVFIWMEPEEPLLGKIIFSFLLILIIGLMLWISFGTKYSLTNGFLDYQSGPIKGKIPIQSIRKIEINKTLWVGTMKPATSLKGLIIHYNRFDEIYISPDSNEKFVEEILKINPTIKIQRFS